MAMITMPTTTPAAAAPAKVAAPVPGGGDVALVPGGGDVAGGDVALVPGGGDVAGGDVALVPGGGDVAVWHSGSLKDEI